MKFFENFFLLLLPIGILGARIYYVIFEWEQYAADPISILYIWNGGLAIYGGIIAGTILESFISVIIVLISYVWQMHLS